MHDDATAAVSPETGAMIDHILTNYHQMHRAGLASLVPWPRLRTRWKTT
ncbi:MULTISPECIES: hypothetical protein [unclassified Paracoccus (in: a-proteobacteria)]|nr:MULTISPECIES: hypothetical protein [unclassified Paracoccus (in: a-proteobacteria)]